jgi:hypothetical protein
MWLRVKSMAVLKVLNYITQPGTFWRREVIDTVGLLNEDLHYAMDYDYWLRMEPHFDLHVVEERLACLRWHSSSKAGSSANAQMDADLEIAKKHVASPVLIGLHTLSNAAIVSVYRLLLAIYRRRVAPVSG